MTGELETAQKELNRDLAPEWLELSTVVRNLAKSLENRAAGSPLADQAAELSGQAGRLCDHVEALHADVEAWLGKFNASGEFDPDGNPAPGSKVVTEKALEIQEEMHQTSDFRQIIKALFMWRDDPVERARSRE